MWKAPIRRRRVVLVRAVIGVAVLTLTALPSHGARAASPTLMTAIATTPLNLGAAEATGATLNPSPWELRRHRAHRISKAGRRVRAIYARAQRARARIPERVRVARARQELRQMQARGPVHCLATAIYFEAKYESVAGQRAVAEVVMARTRVPGRPKSICGVVYEGAARTTGCQFSFACDNRSDSARDRAYWARAKQVAGSALRQSGKKRYARGALFYHASYVKPRWSKRMVRVARIGTHIFYKPRRGRSL